MIIHNAVITGSFNVNGTNVASITSSQASIDALNTYTASLNNKTSSFATTGSNTFVGNQVVSGSLTVTGSITTPGTLTAQTLVVQTITSSVDFVTGSTRFGSLSSNTHVFTGSMAITGALAVNAGTTTLAGSLSGTSATFSGDLTIDTNTLYVDSTNNRVGIGTASPTSRLDVNGEIRMTGSTLFRGMSSSTLQLCGGLSSSNVKIDGTNEIVTIDTNGATRLTIASTGAATFSGNVGLGATSSYAKFNISTGDDNQMAIGTTSTGQTVGIFFADGPTTSSTGYKWEFGKNASNNYFIYSYGTAANVLTLNYSTGAATFSNILQVSGSLGIAKFLASGAELHFSRNDNNDILANGGSSAILTLGANNSLVFKTGTGLSTAMTITGGGNVGIGETNPSSILHIKGASGSTKFTLQPPSGQPNIIEFLTNAGAVDARIKNESTQLQFETGTSGTPKMVITSGGDVGIGITPTTGARLQVSGGQIRCIDTYNNTTATAANLVVSSGGTFERSTSSIRYKTDIENITSDIASLVYKMRPIWYRSLCDNDRKDWSWYGLIAEELATIEPRLVHWGYDDNGELIADGVQYERVVPLLVKAIQELKAEVDDLKSQLNK